MSLPYNEKYFPQFDLSCFCFSWYLYSTMLPSFAVKEATTPIKGPISIERIWCSFVWLFSLQIFDLVYYLGLNILKLILYYCDILNIFWEFFRNFDAENSNNLKIKNMTRMFKKQNSVIYITTVKNRFKFHMETLQQLFFFYTKKKVC